MGIIYKDILKNWTNCWLGAMVIGTLFLICNQHLSKVLKQYRPGRLLFFADGVFLYYLLYVTLLSRKIGVRRELALIPFSGAEIIGGDYHYAIENVLLFIPFGILCAMTLRAYGRKCDMKIILQAAFLTSVSIEFLQFLFSCGKSEADDIITNVLGAIIGYVLVKPKRRE